MPDKINDIYNLLIEKQKSGEVGNIPELDKFREYILNPSTAKNLYEAEKERFPEIFYGNSFEEWYPTIKKKEPTKPSGNLPSDVSTPKYESNFKQRTEQEFEALKVLPKTNFERRMFDENAPVLENKDGSFSTHKMMSFESDGKFYAAPTIVEKNGKLVELKPNEAIDFALSTGEYKEFKTEKEAQTYAQGEYKDIASPQMGEAQHLKNVAKKLGTAPTREATWEKTYQNILSRTEKLVPEYENTNAYKVQQLNSKGDPNFNIVDAYQKQIQELTFMAQNGKIDPKKAESEINFIKQDLDKFLTLGKQISENSKSLQTLQTALKGINPRPGLMEQAEVGMLFPIMSMAARFYPEATRQASLVASLASGKSWDDAIIASDLYVNQPGSLQEFLNKKADAIQKAQTDYSKMVLKARPDTKDWKEGIREITEDAVASMGYSIPIMGAYLTGNPVLASTANYAMFNESAGRRWNEVKDDPNKTLQMKLFDTYANATSEVLFEQLGALPVVGLYEQVGKTLSKKAFVDIFAEANKSGVKKWMEMNGLALSFFGEGAEELWTGISQRAFDYANTIQKPKDENGNTISFEDYVYNKDLMQKEFITGSFMGTIFTAPAAAMGAWSMIKDTKAREAVKALSDRFLSLKKDIETTTDPALKDVLTTKASQTHKELVDIANQDYEDNLQLPKEDREKIDFLNSETDNLKNQLKNNESLTDEGIKAIEDKILENENAIKAILENLKTPSNEQELSIEPAQELKNIEVLLQDDTIPEEDKIKLQNRYKEVVDIIQSGQNEAAKKQETPVSGVPGQEGKAPTQKSQAKPTKPAEPQKPQEPLKPVEWTPQVNDRVVRMVESFNSLTPAKKTGKKGLNILNAIGRSAGAHNLELKEVKSGAGTKLEVFKEGKKLSRTPVPNEFDEPTEEQYEFAQRAIKYGIIPPGSDIGLTESEMEASTKALVSGKRTKEAMRLVHAIDKAKKFHGVEVADIDLRGRKTGRKTFVSFTEIEEITNENFTGPALTPEEEEIMATAYDELFAGLDDDQKQDIENLFIKEEPTNEKPTTEPKAGANEAGESQEDASDNRGSEESEDEAEIKVGDTKAPAKKKKEAVKPAIPESEEQVEVQKPIQSEKALSENKAKEVKKPTKVKLFRGSTQNEKDTKKLTWYSTDKKVAKNYGKIVVEKEVELGKVFDSTNPNDIQILIDNGIKLIDKYSGEEILDATEAANDSDTWDFIENSDGALDLIEKLGYNSVKITEGGSEENYIVINEKKPSKTQIKSDEKLITSKPKTIGNADTNSALDDIGDLFAEPMEQYDLFGSQEPRKGKSDFRKEYEQRVKAAESEIRAKQKEIDAKKKELAAKNADAQARTRILSPMLGQLNVMQQEYQKLLDQAKRVKDAENSQQTLFEAKTNYNPNQMVIDFNNPQQIEISHGSAEKMLENRDKTFLEVEGHYNFLKFYEHAEILYGKEGASKLIVDYITKRTILEEFKDAGFVSLKGKKVRGPQDVADIMAIFRSAYIEKSSAIIVEKKTGKILHNVMFTLNHPRMTSFNDEPLLANIQNLEEAGIETITYITHNHPSENHKASDEDRDYTKSFATKMVENGFEFGGHVIIDTSKFTFIDKEGSTSEIQYKQKPDKLFSTRLNMKDENGSFSSNGAMAVAKAIFTHTGFDEMVLFLDSFLGISFASVVPEGMSEIETKDWLENGMRANGAGFYIVISRKGDTSSKYKYKEAYDYISMSGSSNIPKSFRDEDWFNPKIYSGLISITNKNYKDKFTVVGFSNEQQSPYLNQAYSNNKLMAQDNLNYNVGQNVNASETIETNEDKKVFIVNVNDEKVFSFSVSDNKNNTIIVNDIYFNKGYEAAAYKRLIRYASDNTLNGIYFKNKNNKPYEALNFVVKEMDRSAVIIPNTEEETLFLPITKSIQDSFFSQGVYLMESDSEYKKSVQLSPENVSKLQGLINKLFSQGHTKFENIMAMLEEKYGVDKVTDSNNAQGVSMLDGMKAVYSSMLPFLDGEEYSDFKDVKNYKPKQNDNLSTELGAQPNSGSTPTQEPVLPTDIQPSEQRGERRNVGTENGNFSIPGLQSGGDLFSPQPLPPTGGESGVGGVRGGERGVDAGDNASTGLGESGLFGKSGIQPKSEPRTGDEKYSSVDGTQRQYTDKLEAQKNAPTNVVIGDIKNIAATLPYLMDGQVEDVWKAETRLLKDGKKGILFGNQTGTGKTFLFLGLIKRTLLNNPKADIVIVSPKAPIEQTISSGKVLGLDIQRVKGKTDKGGQIAITTYQTLYQNQNLINRTPDLVIFDESHILLENKEGETTAYLKAARNLVATPDEAFDKAAEILYGKQPEFIENSNNIDYFNWRETVNKNKEAIKIKAKELEDKTKVMLMSATPFSHEFTLRYADGILFTINQGVERKTGGAYNSGDNDDLFFITNFGYRMKNNKLTQPDAKVNLDLMYRSFADNLMKQGAMSVRFMDTPFDYSREFIDIAPGVGAKIDQGVKILESEDYRFPTSDAFSYQYLAPLLEAIKAEAIIDRIKKHIAMGRKVVVFHGYNNPVPQHPFGDRLIGFAKSEAQENDLKKFWDEHPEYKSLELGLNNPISTFKSAFGDRVLLFNGKVTDKDREKAMKDFNTNPNIDIILVNISTGGAGLSLHDNIGQKQRVLINLGLPIRPVQAIQVEGRIYRTGQKSNAIFEYAKTGLDFEMRIFGTKIAERVNATEALVMGTNARNLREVFRTGYLNSNSTEPSLEQGVGGKEGDKSVHSSSPYDFAKTLYWGQQKGRKNDIGTDYFATPEPIGFKMVEFLNLRPGEKVLEPSAGHGAIARFVPEDNILHVIEPSSNLMAKLSVVANPMRKEQVQFEDYNIINKYDGIVMNPPFGHAGKTAMDHVVKAFAHLYDGGRIVAIIPNGQGSARFSNWYESEEAAEAVLVGKIEMPAMFAERAGTGAMTTIYIIDKIKNEEQRSNSAPAFFKSFADAKDNNELFDRIENFEVRPRPEVATPDEKMQDLKENINTNSFSDHIYKAKNGFDWFIARLTENMDYETIFKPLKEIAAKHGNGWYMGKGGKGFAFKTEDDRSAFKVEAQQFINNDAPEADIDGMVSEAKADLDNYLRNSRGKMFANPLMATIEFGAKAAKLMGLYIIKGVKSLPEFLKKAGLLPSKFLRDLWVKMGEVADKYWRQPKNIVTLKQPYSFIAMRNQPYFGAVLNRSFDGTKSMHEIFHNLRTEIMNMEVLIIGNPNSPFTPMLKTVVKATKDILSFITYMDHAEAMGYVDDLRKDRLPTPILYDYNYNEKERVIYNFVYGFRPVETLIKNIRETGAIVTENENPIIGTDLYPGRVADKARAFEEAVLQSVKGPTGKPVYKPSLIERMRADGINIGEVDAKTQTEHGEVMPGFYLGYTYGYETIPTFPEYLHALHAKERNDEVASRRQEAFDNRRIELENAIANGISVDLNKAKLELLLTNLDPQYQLIPDGGSGMTNQEAQDVLDEMLNNPEKLALYNQYAAEFTTEVIMPIQEELVRTGQLSRNKMDELNEMFGNWVHLPVDFYSQGLNSTGMASAQVRTPLKKIKGSTDRRVNPFLATIDYYSRVLRAGEMNLARQQMYNLVKKFPNENLFKIIPPVSGVSYDPDSGNLTPEFSSEPPNSIPVYRNGVVYYIQFIGKNGIHLYDAWNSINKTHDRTLIHRFFRTINAALYFANIKFNPTFLLTNLLRDDLSAILNTLTISEVKKADLKAKIALKVPTYTPKAIRAAYMASRGRTDAATKSMLDYAIRLQNQGGITILGNLVGGSNLEERIDRMAEMIQQMDEKTLLQQMAMPGSYLFNALGDMQSAVENGTRVAVFRASIEAGLSDQEAAAVAKNITVNFDRKGANAAAINDMVWLFKTSASGIARFAKALNTKEGKIIAASLIGIGTMLSMWNRSKCEDSWNSIDEGIKSTKLIYVLDCEHLVYPSIPFAQGWSFFLYLGQLMESYHSGAMNKGDAVAHTARAAVNSINPLGTSSDYIGFATNFLPTALDKGLEFAMNKTWYNKPISPEQYGFEQKLKDSELYWDETSEWAKSMATWLSQNSGSTNAKNEGAIEVSPSTLEYAYKTLAGGLGRDVAGFGTLVSDFENNELGKNINKYPVVRALVTKVSSQNVVNAMYKLYEHGQLNPVTPEDIGKFRALVFMRATQVKNISDVSEKVKEANKLVRLATEYEKLIVKDQLSNIFVDKNLKEISQILSALNR